jgi:hypothetical protein
MDKENQNLNNLLDECYHNRDLNKLEIPLSKFLEVWDALKELKSEIEKGFADYSIKELDKNVSYKAMTAYIKE